MRRLAAAALSLVAACGGAEQKAPEKPKQEAVDERTAEKDAKSLVREIYQTIGRSNTDGLMALVTKKLIVFGPRKADAMATREDVLVTLRGTLDSLDNDRPSVRSGSLAVVASNGGLSAWAVDTIRIAGDEMAVTVVLENDDDFWRVVAAAVAKTPTQKAVRAELAKEAIVPTGMQGIPKVSDEASDAVERFKQGLADADVWGEDLSRRGDAVVIGAAAGEITRGKKAIAALWKKREKTNVRYASAGEITAATTADGQITWVTAPVVRFADEDEPLPLRLFTVFEKSGDGWKMISLQESVALAEDGAGASFKKIAAPGVKVEEPPPPKKDEPAKKKKKKRKKKKRSR